MCLCLRNWVSRLRGLQRVCPVLVLIGKFSHRLGAESDADLPPRVNMYASTWIMTKTEELAPTNRKLSADRISLEKLEI